MTTRLSRNPSSCGIPERIQEPHPTKHSKKYPSREDIIGGRSIKEFPEPVGKSKEYTRSAKRRHTEGTRFPAIQKHKAEPSLQSLEHILSRADSGIWPDFNKYRGPENDFENCETSPELPSLDSREEGSPLIEPRRNTLELPKLAVRCEREEGGKIERRRSPRTPDSRINQRSSHFPVQVIRKSWANMKELRTYAHIHEASKVKDFPSFNRHRSHCNLYHRVGPSKMTRGTSSAMNALVKSKSENGFDLEP